MVEIKDLGENVYLINGKVIELRPGVADLSSDDDREWLGYVADNLYIHRHDRPAYGGCTGCMLSLVRDGRGRCNMSNFHFNMLPESVKARLREEMPDLAGRF